MFIGAGNQVGCRTCCNLCRNVIPEVRVTGILYEFYLYTSSSFNTVNRSFKSLLFILSPDADGNSFSIRFSLLGFYYCSGVTCFLSRFNRSFTLGAGVSTCCKACLLYTSRCV